MKIFFGHPRALFLIASLQMWESFSYYGMRSILILFLTSSLLYSDDSAYTLYAVYISLIEIGGVLGGFLADRYFGARKSIYIGALVITAGHLSMMAIPFSELCLFVGLSLIAAGSALFRVNCATLLGEFYEKDDPRLQAGFTVYYSALNVGAFFATILCGLLGEAFGIHYGFSLAGFGMLMGLIMFVSGRKLLEDKGLSINTKNTKSKLGIYLVILTIPLSFCVISYAEFTMHMLPIVLLAILSYVMFKAMSDHPKRKKDILLILAATILLSLFYACEELIGSSLVLFAERFVDRNIFGFTIPSSTLNSVNPITIIILGAILSTVVVNRRHVFDSFRYIGYAFLIMSGAFTLLLLGNLAALIGAFILISAAELFIGPVVYALCTKLAPSNMRGQSMGIVMLGYSLAGLMSGYLGKYLMVSDEGVNSFYSGFTAIGIVTAVSGLLLVIGVTIGKKILRQI
ncbi:MAG: peptide MFS transporter [Rickettsiales bacterium]